MPRGPVEEDEDEGQPRVAVETPSGTPFLKRHWRLWLRVPHAWLTAALEASEETVSWTHICFRSGLRKDPTMRERR